MTAKDFKPLIVRPAKRGSKVGWVIVTAQVEPETLTALDVLAERQGKFRTDLIREAIQSLIDGQPTTERRAGERRKAS